MEALQAEAGAGQSNKRNPVGSPSHSPRFTPFYLSIYPVQISFFSCFTRADSKTKSRAGMRDELQIVLRDARELPADQLPHLLGELEEVRATAMARLASAPIQRPESDELLDVSEAARRLGVSRDFIYHHSKDFAFTRRMGSKLLFSAAGIEKHIRQQSILTARRHSR